MSALNRHLWLFSLVFLVAFVGSLFFAPRFVASLNKATTTVQQFDDVMAPRQLLKASDSAAMDWSHCFADKPCQKALEAFYTSVGKPAYPVLTLTSD
jgi:hypothetical protein